MKILSWNCRGVAATTTSSELLELCKKLRPTIVFLIETKANQKRMTIIQRRLKFKGIHCVESRGLSGGLCLLWDDSVEIDVDDDSQNVIQADIRVKATGDNGNCSFVYGPPVPSQRRDFWGQNMHLFQDFVQQMDLLELDLKGNRFTWFSNPRNGVITREKLDRALVNWAWLAMFPNAISKAYPAISSDHSPILLDVCPEESSGQAFKYEAFLDDHHECKEVEVFTSSNPSDIDACLARFPPKYPHSLNQKLIGPISEPEIKVAIDDLGSLKAPGPDGLNGQFFKTHWASIKNEVVKVVTDFFQSGDLPTDMNETLLVLVPKVDKPETAAQFRPISCYDSLLFTKATTQEAYELLRILNLYSKASGHRINLSKSGLICGRNMTAEKRAEMETIFSMRRLLKNPDTLWGQILKSIYFPNNDFLSAKKGLQPSWMWASQMEGKDFLLRNGKWMVASGNKIKISAPQKIKFFLWRACSNALAVSGNLHKRKMAPNPNCSLCGEQTESVEHALFLCPWVGPTWFGSPLQWNPSSENTSRFDNWLWGKIHSLKSGKTSQNYSLTYLQVEEWSTGNCIQSNQTTQMISNGVCHWRAPRGDILKCNTDASVPTQGSYAAIGLVVRDSHGYLVSGLSKKILAPSPLVAEALALREAMLLASNLQWKKCMFESDNLSLIKACRQELQIGEIEAITQDVLSLKANFHLCGFLWTNQKGNEAAHLVARSTLNGSIPLNWTVNPHPALRNLLHQEAMQARFHPP
ncbi:Ribonuclease H-like superfamily [Sesbania bispinosa]|nr:Ribonuclease H-like superfamily [Sesbania bispinosa]